MQDALSEVYRYQGGHWREANSVGNARDCPPPRRSGQLADYYPLIAQAVNRLEQSTAETRGTIYDRARAAMVALRGLTPPLSESDINREQLALEIALKKSRNGEPAPVAYSAAAIDTRTQRTTPAEPRERCKWPSRTFH